MDLGLTSMKAIVAGATRGIGRAITDRLADEGCQLGVCARTRTDVTELERALVGRGVTCFARAADAADAASFKQWCAAADAELGGIDIFIWNISAQSRDFSQSFAVDVLSLVACMEVVLPALRASRNGAIVAIGSQAALLSVPGYKSYAAAKAALNSYCGSLARELAPEQIRVNVVSPGEVYHETGLWGRMKRERPDRFEQGLAKNIYGRMATPDDVARCVTFLASPAASFVTGTNLLVDGMSREFIHF